MKRKSLLLALAFTSLATAGFSQQPFPSAGTVAVDNLFVDPCSDQGSSPIRYTTSHTAFDLLNYAASVSNGWGANGTAYKWALQVTYYSVSGGQYNFLASYPTNVTANDLREWYVWGGGNPGGSNGVPSRAHLNGKLQGLYSAQNGMLYFNWDANPYNNNDFTILSPEHQIIQDGHTVNVRITLYNNSGPNGSLHSVDVSSSNPQYSYTGDQGTSTATYSDNYHPVGMPGLNEWSNYRVIAAEYEKNANPQVICTDLDYTNSYFIGNNHKIYNTYYTNHYPYENNNYGIAPINITSNNTYPGSAPDDIHAAYRSLALSQVTNHLYFIDEESRLCIAYWSGFPANTYYVVSILAPRNDGSDPLPGSALVAQWDASKHSDLVYYVSQDHNIYRAYQPGTGLWHTDRLAPGYSANADETALDVNPASGNVFYVEAGGGRLMNLYKSGGSAPYPDQIAPITYPNIHVLPGAVKINYTTWNVFFLADAYGELYNAYVGSNNGTSPSTGWRVAPCSSNGKPTACLPGSLAVNEETNTVFFFGRDRVLRLGHYVGGSVGFYLQGTDGPNVPYNAYYPNDPQAYVGGEAISAFSQTMGSNYFLRAFTFRNIDPNLIQGGVDPGDGPATSFPAWNNQVDMHFVGFCSSRQRPEKGDERRAQAGTSQESLAARQTGMLRLFPSPATSSLSVQLPAQDGANALLQVRDHTGRLLLTQRGAAKQTSTIDVSDLPPGIYLLQARLSDGAVLSEKFVKR